VRSPDSLPRMAVERSGATASSGQDPVSLSRPPGKGRNVLGSSRASSVARLSLEITPTSGPPACAGPLSSPAVRPPPWTGSTYRGRPRPRSRRRPRASRPPAPPAAATSASSWLPPATVLGPATSTHDDEDRFPSEWSVSSADPLPPARPPRRGIWVPHASSRMSSRLAAVMASDRLAFGPAVQRWLPPALLLGPAQQDRRHGCHHGQQHGQLQVMGAVVDDHVHAIDRRQGGDR
jgi:hypothetical protein